MKNNLSNIESQCGIKPIDTELIEIGSNPNFVFINDPNFNTLTLYDVEGNIVNVNSWIECAHYVNGGWVNTQIVNYPGDKYIAIGLFIIAIISTSVFAYIKKYKNA
mgnify:CR=1 FL=1